MQQHSPHRPPQERLPDDSSTRTKRDDRLNDQRTHTRHPDDERLTEADLDERERERGSTHAQM
jgi:hypothetical protein